MSEYKSLNGKKFRICKYTCGKDLTWNKEANAFLEEDGTLHTKERCQQVKSNPSQNSDQGKKQPEKKPETRQQYDKEDVMTLEIILKKLKAATGDLETFLGEEGKQQ